MGIMIQPVDFPLRDKPVRSQLKLWQEHFRFGKLFREIVVDDVVEVVYGEGLLFGPDSHIEQLFDCILPRLVVPDKGVVLEGVSSPFDVNLFEGVRGQLVADDILRRDSEELGAGHTKVTVDVGGVAGAYFQRAVDIEHAVRVAVHEGIHGQLQLVGQPADEAPTGAGGDTAHRDEDAVGLSPVSVLDQPLEHACGFDGEHESGFGFELQMLDGDGDGVCSGAEFGAVDAELFAGIGIAVYDGELAGDFSALFLWNESELLAVDLEQRFHVVDDGVRLRLFVEAGIVPVLGDVVGLPLGHDFVVFDEGFGLGHHAEGLGEGLDRGDGKGAGFLLALELEEAFFGVILHVAQRAQGE